MLISPNVLVFLLRARIAILGSSASRATQAFRISQIPFTHQKELVVRSEIKSSRTEINKLERPLNKMKSIATREEGRRSSIPHIYLQVFVHIPD